MTSKMIKNIIKLICIISTVYSYDILVGSYSKLNSDPTSDIFKNCSIVSQTRMTTEYGSNITSSILRIGTYSQVVNGINYKFLNAYKDPVSNKFKLTDTIVYTGAFSTFLSNPNPTVSSIQALTNEILNTASNDVRTNTIVTKLVAGIKGYASANLNEKNFKILKEIQTFQYYMYNENYYIASATLASDTNVTADYFFFVSELNGVFTIINFSK